MTQNFGVLENVGTVTRFWNRDTILESWHDFQGNEWVCSGSHDTIWQIVTRFCPDLNTLKAFFDPFVV